MHHGATPVAAAGGTSHRAGRIRRHRSVADLVAAAKQHGDARRGIAVFRAAKFACLSCHQVGKHGGTVGPALTDVGKRLKPEEIAEAVCGPSGR